LHSGHLLVPRPFFFIGFTRVLGYIYMSKEKEMISLLTCTLAIAGATHSGSFQFQSETVPHKEMAKGSIAAELVGMVMNSTDIQHVVIRLGEPPSSAMALNLAEHGIAIQAPLGGNSYIAACNPAMLHPREVLAILDIKEILPMEPHWKLHSFLAENRIPTWTMPQAKTSSEKKDPTVAIYVMYHRDVDTTLASSDAMIDYSAKIRSVIETNNVVVMEIPYSAIFELIEEDRVLYLEPALPQFSELNDSNRVVTQADTAQSIPYNLNGEGVSVMVYDGGYGLSSHGDFDGRHTTRDSSTLSNHATHVAGTIGGSGAGSGGTYKGMAPAVTIESYGFEQEGGLSQGFLYTDPGDLEQDYSDAINTYGAVLANNSIGTNTAPNGFPCEWTGDYGITSNLIDSVVRGDLGGDIRIIWANGNERGSSNCGTSYNSTAPPACAKNHITVGALNSNDESMTYFSSWGPTDDGRIKPDISAPGCQDNGDGGVTSCSSSGGYTTMCGTSMACPTVTGLSALIMQDWRNLYPGEPDLMSSTLKALLAHTAEDKFNAGPDCQYGYGSVRVVDAIDHMRADNHAELELSHGESIEMLIFAETPGTIKATIAWDDVPATPLVIPSLVNDIDIVVIDPNGAPHYPWTIDPSNPGAPAVRTQADHLNNIEQVQIDAGVPGVYRIVITGYSIAVGTQKFGLMASPQLIRCASAGITSLDRSSYACDSEFALQVVDCDLNLDDAVLDTVEVTLSSSSGVAFPVTLVESGEATASFFADGISIGDTQSQHGDSITLSYFDESDGSGGSGEVTDSAIVDCESPSIDSITLLEVLTHDATIRIITSEPTSVSIQYGESCNSSSEETIDGALDTVHEIVLNSLYDNTTYKYKVFAYDAAGNAVFDDNNGACYTFTTLDVPNYFTEQDSGFDLDGVSITYIPHENVDGYRACAEPITQLPTDPSDGTSLNLGDDDYETVYPSDVFLYNVGYSQLHISSNGRLTFGSADTDYTETIGEHFAQPGISMLWDDLNPSSGGTVKYATKIDRVVVTFNGVPEYSNTGSNTFQCELYYDGVIRLSYLGIDSNDNIVGLSAGNGTPTDFEEDDISASDDCGDTSLPGDVNGDGFVTVTDLLAVMDSWGACEACPSDLNGDGVVDIVDLLEVIGNWNG
jgi:hypothetical protein